MTCACTTPFGFGAAIFNTVVQTISQGVAGQPTTLQVGVANIGTNTGTITGWTVQLSPGLTGVSFPMLPPGGSASYDNGTGVVTVTNFPTSLAPGGSVCFEITFTQPATGTVTYTIQAAPGAPATNGVSTPPPQVDAAISMTQSAGTVLVGDSLTITATISNLGPAAGDGTNVIPSAPGFVATSATWANPSPGVVGGAVLPNGTANILTFPAGGSIQRVWVGTYSNASAGAVFSAVAQVPGSVNDPVSANNTAAVTTVVTASANLSVTYSAASSVAPSAAAPQTVSISNNGPSAVTGAQVTFSIPPNFVVSGATWTGGSVGTTAGSGSGLSYTTGVMPSGSVIVLTLQGTHTANAAATNYTVTIAPPAGTVDTVSGNDTSSVNVTVSAAGPSFPGVPSVVNQWDQFPNSILTAALRTEQLSPPFTIGVDASLSAWITAIIDEANARIFLTLVGGHSDGRDNSTNRANLSGAPAQVWAQIHPGSTKAQLEPPIWTSGANRQADGTPTSVHSYFTQYYDDVTNRIYCIGMHATADIAGTLRAVNVFDVATQTWLPANHLPDVSTQVINFGSDRMMYFDKARRRFVMHVQRDFDWAFWFYNIDTGAQGLLLADPSTATIGNLSHSRYWDGANDQCYYIADNILSSLVVVSHPNATTATATSLNVSPPIPSTICQLTDNPNSSLITCFALNGGVIELSTINKATGVRTVIAVTGMIPSYNGPGNRPFDKVFYLAAAKALFFVNRATQNIAVIRLAL